MSPFPSFSPPPPPSFSLFKKSSISFKITKGERVGEEERGETEAFAARRSFWVGERRGGGGGEGGEGEGGREGREGSWGEMRWGGNLGEQW